MTVSLEQAQPRAGLARWLDRARSERNLALEPPAGSGAAPALAVFARLSAELRQYHDLVERALEAAERNQTALSAIARSTDNQERLVAEAAGAVEQVGDGAEQLADAATQLRDLAFDAAFAADRAAGGLAEIDGALATLRERLREGRAPVEAMESATGGVRAFLDALRRLSTRAQVLSINAAIEAAHVGRGGTRFEIVASEVRRLSASTGASSTDVAAIAGALAGASGHVAGALDEADGATGGAAREISGANERLGGVQTSISELHETIASLAAIAAQQSRSLASVVSAVGEIARHAHDAAAASRDAAELDLRALLAGAERLVRGWTLYDGAAPLDAPEPCDEDERLALEALVAAVDADERAILHDLVRAAMAVARNVFGWRAIATSLGGVAAEIETVRIAVGESAASARAAAETAARLRAVVGAMESTYEASLAAVDGALGGIATIVRGAEAVGALVDEMNAAAERAGALLGIIDDVSAETSLLSLNAAVESARAGERGRGFGVIAREIRALAVQTHESTEHVAAAIAGVSTSAEAMRGSLAAVVDGTGAVQATAEQVREAFDVVRTSLAATVGHALGVSSTAEEQARALDGVLELVASSAKGIDAGAALATDERRVELVLLASEAHEVASHRSIGLQTERVRALVERVAGEIEAILEDAVDSGRLRLEQLFDFTYTPITGERIASLGRLFDVRRVPRSGFVPSKYVTPWDQAVDERITEVLEAARLDGAFCKPFAAVASDINSFVYAFSRPQTADWTGDQTLDTLNNRVKRLAEDEVLVRNARLGLGPNAEGLGLRLPYAAFERAGCTLIRGKERPWRTFVYARDTSQIFNETTTALYVKGRRHGNLRYIYDADVL